MSKRNKVKPAVDRSVEAAKRYAQKQLELKRKAEQKATADKLKREKQAEERKIKAKNRLLAEQEKQARLARKQKLKEQKAEIARQKQIKRNAVYRKIKNALKNRPSGFDYKNRGLLPRVRIAVSGDFTSVGTALASSGVKVGDIRHSGGETLFTIRKKDSKKAIAILNKMCYNYRIVASFGLWRTLWFCAARCGLIIGAVASAISMYILYGYVWRIQISGNERLSDSAIEAALGHADVRAGQKKSDELLTRAATVLGQTDGISDASCEIVGTTLYVRVLESKDFVVRPAYACYLSAYDATVTRLVVRSGTPLVKRGEVVKRGDVLVSGDVYSTAGELLYTGECDADVYGSVSIGYTAKIPATGVAFKRTGRKSVKTVLSVFGKQMGKPTSPYRSYEMSAHTANYDLLVPLYVTSYTYWETAPVEYERDIEQAVAAFAEEKKQELRFVGEIDYKYGASTTAGMYSVHLFLTGELCISRGSEKATIGT